MIHTHVDNDAYTCGYWYIHMWIMIHDTSLRIGSGASPRRSVSARWGGASLTLAYNHSVSNFDCEKVDSAFNLNLVSELAPLQRGEAVQARPPAALKGSAPLLFKIFQKRKNLNCRFRKTNCFISTWTLVLAVQAWPRAWQRLSWFWKFSTLMWRETCFQLEPAGFFVWESCSLRHYNVRTRWQTAVRRCTRLTHQLDPGLKALGFQLLELLESKVAFF